MRPSGVPVDEWVLAIRIGSEARCRRGRRRRRKRGRCAYCGRKKELPRVWRCESCRHRLNAKAAARRLEYKTTSRCSDCSIQLDADAERCVCDECAARRAKYRKKQRRRARKRRGDELRAASTAGSKKWRADRKARGICIDCAGAAKPGKLRCQPCTDAACTANRLRKLAKRSGRMYGSAYDTFLADLELVITTTPMRAAAILDAYENAYNPTQSRVALERQVFRALRDLALERRVVHHGTKGAGSYYRPDRAKRSQSVVEDDTKWITAREAARISVPGSPTFRFN